MAMTTAELAKDLTVALIDKVSGAKFADPQGVSKWIGEAYKVIYKAVKEAYNIEASE